VAAEDPEAGQLVQLRYFAGLSVEEAADSLGMARTTAYRHWTFARAWLMEELAGGEPD
jgi:DNA-directed RNA polymerase specialized sigma24 family protein